MKRGLALIVVIGILGVLAVLAVAFVAMAQLERRASAQRVNAARAYLLARSGIEDALARLDLGQDPAYGGENWDNSPDGLLSGYEAGQEVFHRTGINTPADMETCPVRHALRPSFFVAAAGNPATLPVDGRDRGYSGLLAGDHAPKGNGYALRVSSGQGFYLNGGDPAAPPEAGYNAVLRRMLGILAKAVDEEKGGLDGKPVDEADGWRLVDARPPGGWRSLTQVGELALAGRRDRLEALAPYLTLHAWVDRKVVAPNATEAMINKDYHSWGEIKLDHVETRPGSRAPDFERIGGRVVGRAPVSLAWARKRRPALIALLGGLRGLYLDDTTETTIVTLKPKVDVAGTLRAAGITLDWSPADDCHRVADLLMASTSELETWRQWDAFCDSLPLPATDQEILTVFVPGTGQDLSTPVFNPQGVYDILRDGKQVDLPLWTADLQQAKRDLLKTAFNPGSNLNKFNPDASRWKSTDKSDLLAYSTEFSLFPIGARQVESVGRVLGLRGGLLAVRALRAAVAGPSVTRLTTQKEFVCEDLGRLDLAGDEGGFRLPGQVPFISRSAGSGKTWGHALGRPGLGDAGASLQTYPEPCVDPGSGLAVNPADYDGSIHLSTVETRTDDVYTVDAGTRDMKMLARYDDGFDLDLADGLRTCLPDLSLVTPLEAGNSLLHALRPNTLHPDGCYSEKDRAPEYLDLGNAHGFHGVMSFWIKRNYRERPSLPKRGHPYVKWTNFLAVDPTMLSPDQFFFLGDSGYGTATAHFEIGHATADREMEYTFKVPQAMPARTWHLVTLYWDFRSPAAADVGELIVDAGLSAPELDAASEYRSSVDLNVSLGAGPARNNAALAADITLPDLHGPHRIALGRGWPLQEFQMSLSTGLGADATFDEFALYDFGGAELDPSYRDPADPARSGIRPASTKTLESPAVLAANRFREGRFCKDTAEWFSPPIRLAGAVRALAWTQVVPKNLPQGRIDFELVDPSGDRPLTGRLRDPALSSLDFPAGTAFRLHAIFQPNLADPENTPLLEPLVLEDVTVVYKPAGGPAWLAWEDGDEG